MKKESLRAELKSDNYVRMSGLVCAAGLGGFLLWGGLAPLEEGVAAFGKIVVEDQRKVVQHLEGGIIQELLVRDGERVEAGEPVVVLKETVSLAARDQILQEYAAHKASLERLRALRDGTDDFVVTALDGVDLGEAERADIIEREEDLFRQQRDSFSADLAVLEARRAAAVTAREQSAVQIAIVERAAKAAREELSVMRTMFAEQLARRDQVTGAERQLAALEGEIAQLGADREASAARMRDFDAQIHQKKATFSQDIAAKILETRTALLSTEERLGAAQDVLDRAVIVAPVAGEVLNLQFATVGGVVQPGETIMEIIPDVVDVTASVQIRPADRASVFEGQMVRTQISAYRGWQTPRLEGVVVDVSADLKTDPATSATYYEARIRIARSDLEFASGIEVIPGMPVDAFIYSGQERTMLDYLLAPISESLFRGLRSS